MKIMREESVLYGKISIIRSSVCAVLLFAFNGEAQELPSDPQGRGTVPLPVVSQASLPEYFPVSKKAVNLHIRPNTAYRADRTGISIQEDVEYIQRDGVKLHLTLVSPGKSSGRHPCIVMVPGSAWRKQVIDPEHAVDYARHGYVVAVMEYRHSGIAPFPAQIQDCRTAVRFMRKNADAFGVDADNIFLLGDSSGGHTVLLAATSQGSSLPDTDAYSEYSDRVNAVAAFYPPTDIYGMIEYPSTIDHNSPESNEGAFLGGIEVASHKEEAWKASPVAYVSDRPMPPVLLATGSRDQLVPSNQSDRYALRLQEYGKDFVFYNLVGASHGSSEFFMPEMVGRVMEFFNKHKSNQHNIMNNKNMENNQFYVHVNGHVLTVDLQDNSSARAIVEELKKGDITIPMEDYANFEKFGRLPRSFPRNDEQITTSSGDVILSEGNLLVIYYDRNSWRFTRLGKIRDVSQSELKKILGAGDVRVRVSLEREKR